MPTSALRRVPWAGLALAAAWALAGCGTFAFYEDTKIAIALAVDPAAPDPVEITAAFKEGVYALAPIKRRTTAERKSVIDTGPILADFDVRYGVNANAAPGATRDVLYAVITHGLATGDAAQVRRALDEATARRAVIVQFVGGLDEGDLRRAATALGLEGPGAPDAAVLRRRLAASVRETAPGDLTAVERALAEAFPSRFRPWTPG